MRLPMLLVATLVSCTASVAPPGAAGPPDAGEAQDAAQASGAYLIVTVSELEAVAAEWAAWREGTGFAASVVLAEELTDDPEDGDALSGAVAERAGELAVAYPDRPVHILLLGDTELGRSTGLPPTLCANDLGTCFTDNDYAGRSPDGVPTYAVGRIPVETEAEGRAALSKQQAFETQGPLGEFNRRFFFYAGESGFDEDLAQLAEGMVLTGIKEVNPAYDIVGLYNDPYSSYYYTPFETKVVELFNEGSVFSVYLGHGSSAYNDGLSVDAIEQLDAQGRLPYLALFACSNGEYAGSARSVAEAAYAVPGGPIGVLAASGLSHPYGNAVFPYELQRSLFSGAFATIGEVLVDSKRQVSENEDDVRALLDFYGGTEGLSESEMRRLREQHLDLYNLMGDPASPLLLPPGVVTLEVAGETWNGSLAIRGSVDNVRYGTVVVSLQVARDQILGDLEPIDARHPNAATVQRNWATAVDKVVVETKVPVEDGAFEATLDFDPDLPGSDFFVKAYARDGAEDALGAISVR